MVQNYTGLTQREFPTILVVKTYRLQRVVLKKIKHRCCPKDTSDLPDQSLEEVVPISVVDASLRGNKSLCIPELVLPRPVL